MWNKLLGGAIIIGAIFAVIFSVKYIPIYLSNKDLEAAFQECVGNFQTYQEQGCRMYFKKIIDDNKINLDPNAIKMDIGIYRESTINATYSETLDFFGVWKYEKTFSPHADGVPPRRT